MKEKLKNLYYLPLLPLNIIVIIILNFLIIKNTPDCELNILTEEEYIDTAMGKFKELWLEPFTTVLDILATISWGLIINWLFF
jgi:hypothetical protein